MRPGRLHDIRRLAGKVLAWSALSIGRMTMKTLTTLVVLLVVPSLACAQPVGGQAKADVSLAALKPVEVIDLGGVPLELVLVPAGEFKMGRDDGCAPEEKPVHSVRISRPFYMGKFEVTQEQYAKVMGTNPSSFVNPRNPVENVSWEDAQEFCRRLSALSKKNVQLPTEAQWEYAARAGRAANDEGIVFNEGWHDNSGRHPHPVGQKPANPFGLHDMFGNVGEWCSDWYDENYYASSPTQDPQGPPKGTAKVLRGGAWGQHVASCMPACRQHLHPITRYYYFGFRIVVTLPKPM